MEPGLRKLLTRIFKALTLIFVSGQFDRLDDSGARAELRKMGEGKIIDYLKGDNEKTQLLLGYVYLGNRIGNAIITGILDKETVFGTWGPGWWRNLWETFKPLVEQERERRKDPKLYDKFERFVKEHCQEKNQGQARK